MEIKEQIQKDLGKILEQLGISAEKLVLEHPAESSFGDYATNIALRVKKEGFADPMTLAEEIVNTWRLSGLPDYIAKIEIAPPGFINLWLAEEFLISQTHEVLTRKDKFGRLAIGEGKTMVIDYSGPNIAKPFGIGHLRSTNIGQALYNLYKFLGWKAVGDNHLGDWGTQFGKLIYQIELKMKNEKLKMKDLTIEKLEKWYVDFHKKAAEKPELEDEARMWFKKIEDGNREARQIWRVCVEISIQEFGRIYDLLGVKIDHAYGESFYEDKMADVVAWAKRKRLLEESEGAQVIRLAGLPPAILLKSDGATTYLLRDLATIAYRRKRWKADLYLYEVGADQKLYFQQLFVAANLLGYGKKVQFVHVPHGLIRWPEGKFSTREGKTIHLEDVLGEAIRRAEKIIKSSATDRGLSARQRQKVAQAVGIGAVKYSDLKQNPQTDIIFDWERIFNLEGDSGPYLQYTYARCVSVLSKSKSEKSQSSSRPVIQFPEEMAILRTIYRFPEVVQEAAESFSPNLLCVFLFDLCQKYNLFYNKHQILESPKKTREFRLALTAATAQVLKNGLTLLGIEVPERM